MIFAAPKMDTSASDMLLEEEEEALGLETSSPMCGSRIATLLVSQPLAVVVPGTTTNIRMVKEQPLEGADLGGSLASHHPFALVSGAFVVLEKEPRRSTGTVLKMQRSCPVVVVIFGCDWKPIHPPPTPTVRRTCCDARRCRVRRSKFDAATY